MIKGKERPKEEKKKIKKQNNKIITNGISNKRFIAIV